MPVQVSVTHISVAHKLWPPQHVFTFHICQLKLGPRLLQWWRARSAEVKSSCVSVICNGWMFVTCEGHSNIPAMFCGLIGLVLLTESSMPGLSEAWKHVTNLLSVTKEIFHRGWVLWLYGFVVCDLFYLSCIRVKILISDFVFRRGLLAGFMLAYLLIITCPGHIRLRYPLILHVESHTSTNEAFFLHSWLQIHQEVASCCVTCLM